MHIQANEWNTYLKFDIKLQIGKAMGIGKYSSFLAHLLGVIVNCVGLQKYPPDNESFAGNFKFLTFINMVRWLTIHIFILFSVYVVKKQT